MVFSNEEKPVIKNYILERKWNGYKICKKHPTKSRLEFLSVWKLLEIFLPKMSHDYSPRTKKKSVVSSECLQTLEASIINNIKSLKDKSINVKDTVTKKAARRK